MSNETTRKSLKEAAKEFDSQLPIMEGREKGETAELLGQVSTIIDYGFLPSENGEPYVVFIVKERPTKFYFGGSVLTARLVELDEKGYGDDIRSEGIPALMTSVKGKSNRTYTAVKFYPDEV